MARLRHVEICVELSDLCHDVMNEIRQQLAYYRASVYKDETAGVIRDKVEQLRLIAGLMADQLVLEPLHDYDAMAQAGVMNYVPGECSFSRRVTGLLASLDEQLSATIRRAANKGPGDDITKSIHRHKRELLKACRHGSRHWSFFQSI